MLDLVSIVVQIQSTVSYWYDCSYSYWNGDLSSPCQTFEVYNVDIPWGQPVGDYEVATVESVMDYLNRCF